MKKDLKIKFEKLNQEEQKVARRLIRLEVSYCEQKEPKKEVKGLIEKAWSLLIGGSLNAAIELISTIIEAVKSGSDPP